MLVNKLSKLKLKQKILIGLLLLCIFLVVVVIHLTFQYRNKKDEEAKLTHFYENQDKFKSGKGEDIKIAHDDYIALIDIPKINVFKGLYDINSKENDVSKNIQIIETSTMPNIENGNLILAAHSGNDDISYFKDLNKLTFGDNVFIEYNGVKYEYKVANFYNMLKTGSIDIIRNTSLNTLTLVTCSANGKKQLIVICELYNTFVM